MGAFGSVTLKSRPIKLAFLVDPNDATQVRDAIRLACSVWGGAYCPIVPLHSRLPRIWKEHRRTTAKEIILGYIDAFDPDVLVQMCEDVPGYVVDTKLGIIKGQDIWAPVTKEESRTPRFAIGVLELLNEVFNHDFKYKTKYPMSVIVPRFPKELELFWASYLGEFPTELLPILREGFYAPLEVSEPEVTAEELIEVLKPTVLFPRRCAQLSLEHIPRSGARRSAYAFFMDATKVDDIIDFWNLRALGRSVAPIPKQLASAGGMLEVTSLFLKDSRRHWRHNKAVCDFAHIVRSRNSTMDELKAFAKTIDLKPDPSDTSQDGFFSLQHWYPRFWDSWAREKDGVLPDDFYGEEETIDVPEAKDSAVSFEPLIPKFAEKHSFHMEPRCANEVDFRFYGSSQHFAEFFPKSHGDAFLRSISDFGALRKTWRIGRNGLVRLVSYRYRNRWQIPDAEKTFFAWLKDQGWEAELSSAGRLAKQLFKQLDGNTVVLTNEKVLGLLEHMNGGTVQNNGLPTTNNRIRQSRELPIGEIRFRLNDPSLRGNPFDYLVSRNVFHVGIRIQCPECFRRSWYAIDQVGPSFSCPLCLVDFSAISNAERGEWCYKTTGPFSVPGYADGAYATLLAVDFFSERKLTTIRTTPVLSFTAKSAAQKVIEADFALFWRDAIFGEEQSGIAFGECKTYGEFEQKDFARMRHIAKQFPGAVLVFATIREKLSAREVREISKIAKAGRKYWKDERPINPILILGRNELLSMHSVPGCWEESVKNRFQHIHGLISICDATQQIYLGLDSWHRDWDEQIQRRRQKLIAKQDPSVAPSKPPIG